MTSLLVKPSALPSGVKKKGLKRYWPGLVAAVVLAVGTFHYYNVDKSLTHEDITYIEKFLRTSPEPKAARLSYAEQLSLLQSVQHAVMARTELAESIPVAQSREPKDLYLSQKGLCYSRSRVLEKIYMSLGFKTRHVSVYADVPSTPLWKELFRPGSPSHATLEVLTAKGWMIVDSNIPWLAVDKQRRPYSFEDLAALSEAGQHVRWAMRLEPGYDEFYNGKSFYVYGLYSRHGQFYPPYTRGVPDYNARELLYNL
ncbi:hypothetical protein FY528_13485 [Hymenobacter lutimineralis]|uniref:Transglutaminase-like domain-containing protein n=1 Tax=Hymenobacter lutimineralis TaxID=2606448 RepID=A0A5D6UWV7_9BACT|nr:MULTISPECIES: hypothetical protein [Hymenobacter]QIX63263.1 hypothetical protein HER32_19625 [Hymenobacter sp. BT18]TYZ08056.1 hypothetical protein FY528_13485 [Hymenobacter lutimineralis]